MVYNIFEACWTTIERLCKDFDDFRYLDVKFLRPYRHLRSVKRVLHYKVCIGFVDPLQGSIASCIGQGGDQDEFCTFEALEQGG